MLFQDGEKKKTQKEKDDKREEEARMREKTEEREIQFEIKFPALSREVWRKASSIQYYYFLFLHETFASSYILCRKGKGTLLATYTVELGISGMRLIRYVSR